MTAVFEFPKIPKWASTFVFANEPCTFLYTRRPPVASIKASVVPSPPSAIGIEIISALGKTFLIPFSIA